jgi:uncharacterized protein (TIGR00251 family)
MRLPVKVVPKSSRDALVGWVGDALKVHVKAPPERGRANEAVRKLLAEALGVPRDRVRVVVGPTSRQKIFAIDGLDELEIRRRIEAATG